MNSQASRQEDKGGAIGEHVASATNQAARGNGTSTCSKPEPAMGLPVCLSPCGTVFPLVFDVSASRFAAVIHRLKCLICRFFWDLLFSLGGNSVPSIALLAVELPTGSSIVRMGGAHKTPSAFAEAMGGAIGALWTTLLFYPLDVAKLRLQAEADSEEEGRKDEEYDVGREKGCTPKVNTDISEDASRLDAPDALTTVQKKGPRTFLGEVLVVLKQPELWYAGLGLKLQLSVLSTFIYFYVYTALKRVFTRAFKRPVTFLPNLALASMAGVVNVLLTMPLDTLVTRLQVAPAGRRPSLGKMLRLVWEEDGPDREPVVKPSGHEAGAYGVGMGGVMPVLRRLARFWHGCLPALLLTSNPAINYAAYDAMKTLVPLPQGRRHHNVRETFLIGMLSKFLATLITYPLIRAKVIMMSDTKRAHYLETHFGVNDHSEEDAESIPLGLSPRLLLAQERQGLCSILKQLIREGGVRELYVGLDGQVLNTALKNATLLNTKDRISRVTSFLLRRFFAYQ